MTTHFQRATCTLLLIAIGFFCSGVRAGDVHATLKQSAKAFEKNDCKRVISLLKPLQDTHNFDDENQFADLYHMLGVCYFQQGKKDLAEKELRDLLFLKPDYVLDPFATPPQVLKLFAALKTETHEKLKEIEQAREKAAHEEQAPKKEHADVKTEQPEKKRSRNSAVLAAFVPFGFGQFQNGETTKGALIAASEGALLALNISAYWWKNSYVTSGTSGVASSSTKTSYTIAQSVQFTALGLFLGVYIYSVTDSLLNLPSSPPPSDNIKQQTAEFLQELDRHAVPE